MDKPIVIQSPDVNKVLINAEQMFWGTLTEYRGTQAALLAAGVAQPYMFENMSKSGLRYRSDEFGDRYQVKKEAKGNWYLCLYHAEEPGYRDVTDKVAQKCKWYPQAKADVDIAVGAILMRMMAT